MAGLHRFGQVYSSCRWTSASLLGLLDAVQLLFSSFFIGSSWEKSQLSSILYSLRTSDSQVSAHEPHRSGESCVSRVCAARSCCCRLIYAPHQHSSAPAGALLFWFHTRRQLLPPTALAWRGLDESTMKTVWTLGDFRACWLEAHAVKMSHALILPSPASTASHTGKEAPLWSHCPPCPSLGKLNTSLLLNVTAQVPAAFYFIV